MPGSRQTRRARHVSFLHLAFASLLLVAVAPGVRAQTSQALTHLAHVATGFDDVPGGRGLAVTTTIEVNAAMRHANLAAGHPDDLDAMKAGARAVIHALTPAGGAQGPGLGVGVARAADLVATHVERAVNAPDASDHIRSLGPGVALAARAVAGRAREAAAIARRVLDAGTAAEAAPLVAELRTQALQLDTGRDVNGNGRIDLDVLEPGTNQLEAQIYTILERERLPRVLR